MNVNTCDNSFAVRLCLSKNKAYGFRSLILVALIRPCFCTYDINIGFLSIVTKSCVRLENIVGKADALVGLVSALARYCYGISEKRLLFLVRKRYIRAYKLYPCLILNSICGLIFKSKF